MTIKSPTDILILNIITVLFIIVIAVFPSNGLRLALGLPFSLFIPGYMLMAILFPKRDRMNGTERIAMALVLSLIIVAICGYVLNFTQWGVRLFPVLVTLTVFILMTSLIAWLRLRRLSRPERLEITLNLPRFSFKGRNRTEKALISILALAVLGTIGTISYLIAAPRVGEQFTEFYILGPGGEIGDYPAELALGTETAITAVIVNKEHETSTYHVQSLIDGVINSEMGPLVLNHDEKQSITVVLHPVKAGSNQKVEFLLYKHPQAEVYRSLYILVNIE